MQPSTMISSIKTVFRLANKSSHLRSSLICCDIEFYNEKPYLKHLVCGRMRQFSSNPSSDEVRSSIDVNLDDSKNFKADDQSTEKGKPVEGNIDLKDPNYLCISNPRWIKGGIDQRIIDILSGKGITQFTPVQAEAFDPILAGRDVIGRSRTGTGKTLAFGLPGITSLVKKMKEKGNINKKGLLKRGRRVSMIVLCPTRELARQTQQELGRVAKPFDISIEVFHGGVSYEPQSRALQNGLDILVGTPGRVIDHIERGNLDLSECEIAVLDEADEMLNMGFADDVEVILDEVGSKNEQKTQCLLFSATTPPWIKNIARKYQDNALSIDSTSDELGARTATTVRHLAIQLPQGDESKLNLLEDIIAVEISKDTEDETKMIDADEYPSAAAAAKKKKEENDSIQQKIFGKTIVFTETKKQANEIVSGSVFKSLTAQALHGDITQRQRDSTLAAFREGGFNVLVATDVAARGIDIQNVDLIIQLDPPRDTDAYVHRSGRTGRAGQKGISVLLFNHYQASEIVKIERDLGHGFNFELIGPPSREAALKAAGKTSAIACRSIPEEIAQYFNETAIEMLEGSKSPENVVAKCLAAISRRSTSVQSRSLLTGEEGLVTVEMSSNQGYRIVPRDVMSAVREMSCISQSSEAMAFECVVGKIQSNSETGTAAFDMSAEDGRRLIEFSRTVHTDSTKFKILEQLEIERGRDFGYTHDRRDRRNGRGWRENGNQNRDRYNSRGQDNRFRGNNRKYENEFPRYEKSESKSKSKNNRWSDRSTGRRRGRNNHRGSNYTDFENDS